MKLQLAKQFNENKVRALLDADAAHVSYKLDGVRGKVSYINGKVSIESREGKPLRGLDAWAEFLVGSGALGNFNGDFVWDGEFTVKGQSFQKACGMIRAHTPIDPELVHFTVFQTLVWRGEDCTKLSFVSRASHALPPIFEKSWPLYVNSWEELQQTYLLARERGFEGLIVKELYGVHKEGKKEGWYKMKPEDDADGKVTGVTQLYSEVLGQYIPEVGALEVTLEDGTQCSVGTGMTQQQRRDWWRDRSLVEGHLIRVRFMERTDDGNLRHPAFDGFRDTPEFPGVKA